MIQTLYTNSSAWVSTGLCCSTAFQLKRGMRQGCPPLPLLFAISLEPLAQAIRQDYILSPITIGCFKHYISLFADDILLYMSNLSTSLSQCLKIFKDFSNVSGYKINWEKSVLMPLSASANTALVSTSIPISKTFKYLGIQIFPTLHTIVKQNYISLFTAIRQDLQRWGALLVSLEGRIPIIKMNILPRLLFSIVFYDPPFPI